MAAVNAPQSKHWRDSSSATGLAKRLDCGDFSTASRTGQSNFTPRKGGQFTLSALVAW